MKSSWDCLVEGLGEHLEQVLCLSLVEGQVDVKAGAAPMSAFHPTVAVAESF